MATVARQPFRATGGFRELVLLFLPISLMTFSSCLFLFVEKLLLARLSLGAMEAAVNAAYACQIFQAPCVALAMMAQVFVGRWRGEQDHRAIGPGLWQFIWFSLLSNLFTIPCGVLYGHFYFRGSVIEEIVLPYYHFLLGISFLFPLGASLTCFYLGQGKTRLVLLTTIGCQLIKLLLAYLFIFGWGRWIPSWGILGGALSTLVAQAGLCSVLFFVFFSRKYAESFQTRVWQFKLSLFWECINPGLLRAGNRILNYASWASIAYLMSQKGGDYLLILSLGGTLFLFLPFLAEAVCQAETTVISNLIGSKKYSLLDKAFRSGSLLVGIMMVLSAIPLLFFSSETFHYFFPKAVLDDAVIFKVFFGVWMCFAFFTYLHIPLSYVLAFKDTKFSFAMGFFNWINGFLLMYVVIVMAKIEADDFWLWLSVMHASTALMYYWRMKWLQRQEFRIQNPEFRREQSEAKSRI